MPNLIQDFVWAVKVDFLSESRRPRSDAELSQAPVTFPTLCPEPSPQPFTNSINSVDYSLCVTPAQDIQHPNLYDIYDVTANLFSMLVLSQIVGSCEFIELTVSLRAKVRFDTNYLKMNSCLN